MTHEHPRPLLRREGWLSLDGRWDFALDRDAKPPAATRRSPSARSRRASMARSGFCYTQLTDTYQETNGLLRMDRTPKAPLERLVLATAGVYRSPRSPSS